MKLLYHFTQKNKVFPELSAKQKFYEILDKKRLIAFPNKGYFHKKEKMPPTVAFTELDFSQLERVLERRSEYAFCFQENKFNDNLGPVIYLSYEDIKNNEFDKDEKWLIDLEGLSYNFSWENECRHKDDFKFHLDDILFVIAPDKDRSVINMKYPSLVVIPSFEIYETKKKIEENPIKLTDKIIESYYERMFTKFFMPENIYARQGIEMETDHIRSDGELVDDSDENIFEASDDSLEECIDELERRSSYHD
jgi:hypothetical protein